MFKYIKDLLSLMTMNLRDRASPHPGAGAERLPEMGTQHGTLGQ